MDFIEVDGLRLRCIVGVREEERRDRSDVVIDLVIGTDARCEADSLGEVWDYRAAVKTVIAVVEASAFYTVEKLASQIAEALVVEHGAPTARVRVRKPGAVRFADSAGISIERGPADYGLPDGHRPGLADAPVVASAAGSAR